MPMNPRNIKYFIYARKSSESDEKQVQSIDDQIKVMRDVAHGASLEIVDVFSEAKSAKEPNRRKEFDRMLSEIKKGTARGVLCWKLDRLSRNPDEAGKILGMLQRGEVQHIRTHERDYFPEDNALISYVEFGMADQYSRDLSKNVKRGQQSKLDKGWRPGTAPIGYLNTKTEARGENYLVIDPERFPLIRKAWDLMLTGNYTVDEICDKLNNEWGFRTRITRKKHSRPIARSTLYHIFTSLFYAGIMQYGGKELPGKHEPMVSLDEYDRVQFILGREGKPRPARHGYAYAGMMRCGECGGLISGTRVRKILKGSGKVKIYVFYYCHDARKHRKCSQGLYTNAVDIDAQILEEIEKFTIMPEFRDWALDALREQGDEENVTLSKIQGAHLEALSKAEKRVTNLTHMRIQDLIDDEEYLREKKRLQEEITSLKVRASQADMNLVPWTELAARAFEFASNAREAFFIGDDEVRKTIFSAIGLNRTLKDHNVNIQAAEWLVLIAQARDSIHAELDRLEPTINGFDKRRNDAFTPVLSNLRERRDSNP
jgi:site-specific DNA recombinase